MVSSENSTHCTHDTDHINGMIQKFSRGKHNALTYYFSRLNKICIFLFPIIVVLYFFLFRRNVNFEEMPNEGVIVILSFLFCLCIFYLYLVWKSWKPALIIQQDGFICNQIGLLRSVKVEWERVEGLVEDEVSYLKIKFFKRLRIVYKKKNNSTGLIVLFENQLQKGDEAFLILKNLIPKKAPDISSLIKDSLKIDTAVACLILSGLVLAIAGVIVLSFYPPTIKLTWVYPFLLIPLCVFPFFITLMLQFNELFDKQKRAKSIYAAISFNLGTLVAIAILFLLSPASYYWLLADINALNGHMTVSKAYYQKAEKDLFENADFLFAYAQMYKKNNDWENASRYYILSYEKDPTNWLLGPLENIPDSLYKSGKIDEALFWCNKIIDSYSNRNGVVKAIERKKVEFLSEQENDLQIRNNH